jgi:hypothetical protein
MKIILIVLAVAAVFVVAGFIMMRLRGGSAAEPAKADAQYQVVPSILTPAERSFLGVLEPLLPEGVTYLVKIRLGDVFVPRKGLDNSRRTSARNRINQKHVDVLLVSTSDFKPLAGVELDDSSHAEDRRKARDAFVDEVFRSGGVPLLHIPAQATYNPNELRAQVAAALESPTITRAA